MRLTRFNMYSVLSLILGVAYFGSVASSLVSFAMFRQAVYMWELGMTPIDAAFHFRGWRYLLVYPVFLANARLGVDLNWLFSGLVAVAVLLTGHYLAKTAAVLSNERGFAWKRFAAMFACVAVSLLMNGRIAFAHLGMAILLFAIESIRRNRMSLKQFSAYAALSFFLSNVSSGTMMVVLFMLVWIGGKLATEAAREALAARLASRNVVLAGCVVLILAGAFPFTLANIQKNLDYYGGGLSGAQLMLTHGSGVFLLNGGWVTVFMAGTAMATLALVLTTIAITSEQYRTLAVCVLIAILCGLFGYSTMTMGIPAVIVGGIVAISNTSRLRVSLVNSHGSPLPDATH